MLWLGALARGACRLGAISICAPACLRGPWRSFYCFLCIVSLPGLSFTSSILHTMVSAVPASLLQGIAFCLNSCIQRRTLVQENHLAGSS